MHSITVNVRSQKSHYIVHDKYTRRNYQVVPLTQVHNLPAEILECLNRYEFILIEEGREAAFMAKRACHFCLQWCNPNVSTVTCVGCKNLYHLTCAGLDKKLSKGFAWECFQCLKKDVPPAAEASDEDTLCGDPKESKPADADARYSLDAEKMLQLQGKQKSAKIHILETIKNLPKPSFPFRYFGEYSRFEDLITDTEGRPKAASR